MNTVSPAIAIRNRLQVLKTQALDNYRQQIITLHTSDHATCAFMIGDISGITGEKIADKLIDRVIAFFLQ